MDGILLTPPQPSKTQAFRLNYFSRATPPEEGGGNNFPAAELSHPLDQLRNQLRLEKEFFDSQKAREMNPTSPLPEGKWKLQAQDKATLQGITFYKGKKSMLQLLQKEIHGRKTGVLPIPF